MNLQEAVNRVVTGASLSAAEMGEVMQLVMTGAATDAQIGGLLIGLRMKGESVDEIEGAVRVMRDLASRVEVPTDKLVDTCGTGGDGARLFNVSTASAFAVAAAGGRVAKHGNRSVSSSSGSADVLELAGVRLDLSPAQVGHCITEVGVGFLFAPAFHGAMKHAIGPRKELATRTIFNLLGPMTNPASAPNQVIGVFSRDWQRPMAEVLQRLGSRHVMVVHAEDGLDEISIAAATHVVELRDGNLTEYDITPEQFGLSRATLADLSVENAEQSLALIRQAMRRDSSAAQDLVALNAGAALYVAGVASDHQAGVDMAMDALASGLAGEKLKELADFCSALEQH